MLEARELTVRYGAVPAVQGVSVSVPPAKVVALLGANGAGKTSTLAAITGLLPHGGDVRIDGEPVNDPATARARGIVHVPQGRGLFRRMTVEQNLVLGGFGQRRRVIDERVREAQARIPEAAAWAGRRVGSLSGGEQALVALARLVVGAPRFALLDEPALGLSPVAADRLYEEVARLREDGVGILLVEQYAPRALAIADEAVVLEHGRVVREGPPETMGSAEELVATYLEAAR
ncbi:MAG: ABC transporter ATP-binding protein [Acidimicrobiia bacterium]